MDLYYKIVTYVLAGVLGLCVGSFLNVVIYRVPIGLNLATPSSHCPKCKYVLRWYDNIPVLSYIILGGKCRNCKARISFRYTAVELANMVFLLISVALFWKRSIPFACIAALASSVLICVFFIDLEHKLIFDRFVIVIAVLGIAAVFFDPYYAWLSHIIGGVGGFVSFYGIAYLFIKIKKVEGLGGGDIKLTAVCGLLLGWQRLLLSILMATITASIVLLLLSRKNAKEGTGDKEYPFAPFLSTAFAISMFCGERLIALYLSLLGL